MKKCIKCGSKSLTQKTEQLLFNDVALVEGTVYTCDQCGSRCEALARIEQLSKNVAHFIAHKEEHWAPEQVRFLRTYLGLASKDLAKFLDVAPETVSRWESKTTPMLMELRTEKTTASIAPEQKRKRRRNRCSSSAREFGAHRYDCSDRTSIKMRKYVELRIIIDL